MLSVLAVLVLLSICLGLIIELHLAQRIFIRRDLHRLQARYAAEAGIHESLVRLEEDTSWRPMDESVEPIPGLPASISIEPFGAFLVIRSDATFGRARTVMRTVVGAVPSESFRNAVYLWDTESNLTVAGTTHISGPIMVGEKGLQRSTFEGHPFRGEVDDDVFRTQQLRPVPFDSSYFVDAVTRSEAILAAAPDDAQATHDTASAAPSLYLPSQNRVYHSSADTHITVSDSALFNRPVTIVSDANLLIEGPLRFMPGTTFVAGRTLTVSGKIQGTGGLMYGRDGVSITSNVHCSAQVFSHKIIRLTGDAYLSYPSVLFIDADSTDANTVIRLENQSVVDGTVAYPAIWPRPAIHTGHVIVADSAFVRGAIYNGQETELHGSILGSVLTYEFYFYKSPTSYINWLWNTDIYLEKRPTSFLVPMGFGPNYELSHIPWDNTTINLKPPDARL